MLTKDVAVLYLRLAAGGDDADDDGACDAGYDTPVAISVQVRTYSCRLTEAKGEGSAVLGSAAPAHVALADGSEYLIILYVYADDVWLYGHHPAHLSALRVSLAGTLQGRHRRIIIQ